MDISLLTFFFPRLGERHTGVAKRTRLHQTWESPRRSAPYRAGRERQVLRLVPRSDSQAASISRWESIRVSGVTPDGRIVPMPWCSSVARAGSVVRVEFACEGESLVGFHISAKREVTADVIWVEATESGK